MSHSSWQLNPALSLEHDKEGGKILIGLTEPNCYEISDECEEVLQIIQFLSSRSSVEKKRLIEKIESLFRAPPEDVFQDLKTLKLIRPFKEAESRYARHELYFDFADFSPDAQKVLSRKSVLLIGVGGVGSNCAMLLAAAGVGRLFLADADVLELSNLTRTTLFEMSDLGASKAESARQRLLLRNPEVSVQTLDRALDASSAAAYEDAFRLADIVILSGDSGLEVHEHSYLLSKKHATPLINAGYIEHCGVVGPLTVGENDIRQQELFEDSQKFTQLNRGYKAASYGPLNALVSSIAVNEVIRFLCGQEARTLNRRLLINSCNYEQRWETFS